MNNVLSYTLLLLGSVILSIIHIGIIKYFSEGEKISVLMKGVVTVITTICVYMAMHLSARPIAELLFAMLLIITGGIDHKTKTVVVGLTVLLGLSAALATLLYMPLTVDVLIGGAFGFGFYLAIYWVAKFFYKKEAFGYGDVIFMGVIGLFLGLQYTILASLLTFYVALVFIVIFAIVGKLTSRKAEVAFAPYMALSAWIVSYFGKNIIDLYVNLFIK